MPYGNDLDSKAQTLKRVFGIDIETCASCGGSVRIVASIEDAITIDKILTHRNEKTDFHPLLPESRAPPHLIDIYSAATD